MFLARKITRAKWVPKQELSAGEIAADAVTVDLKTQENTLSFWACPTEAISDIEEAALAIAAAGTRVDKLDIIWLTNEELHADGQTLRNTKGHTPVTDLAAKHVDVSRLDYVRLGRVADRVVAAIEADRYRRLTKAQVKTLLKDAIGLGRVDVDHLEDKVRAEVAS